MVGFVFGALSSEDVKGSLVFFLFGLGLDFFEDFLVFVLGLLLLVLVVFVIIIWIHFLLKLIRNVLFLEESIFWCFSYKKF